MKNSRNTCGFVLKIAEHGESDKLVTLYSRDVGRMTGIAKGARKSKQRFVNKLELFSSLKVLYRPPRVHGGLHVLDDAELLNARLPLRLEYRRYAVAIHLSELFLRFTRENDPDAHLYELLRWTLDLLSVDKAPLKIMVFSYLHLLAASGYRPELDRCGSCRHPITPGRTYTLIAASGSLLCDACQPPQRHVQHRLSVQTLHILTRAQTMNLERLGRLQLPRHAVIEAMNALHHYTLHLLQQDIHSWRINRLLLDER
ncbi:DNA repair protein RecO [Desulfobulbus propionicus DSM 2032]|uniref:DNA repair protein RecO n=1 Tax=Desulfobulbus propionicus (strain ATCC 33891 / DSM 2032 / VKM B-1956 / 1pr3) TaxID=577650 RepID=A0A7U3YNS5_DESPD|nr:DNA repair protein RecO [Desulfobulbus propionicus]ADW18752.1 DNA repair protein RecO [Desulfobulbus propionicus DSM 2032]